MDKTQAVLSQYDIAPARMRKGRGVLIFETKDELFQLKEYPGPKERLTVQNELTKQLSDNPDWIVENIIPNKEGGLYVQDPDKRTFILLTMTEGKECNVTELPECLLVTGKLREVHEQMYLSHCKARGTYHFADEVEKHSKDLARARKFIRSRHHLTEFELELLSLYDHFGKQAEFVRELCKDETVWQYEEQEALKGSICHGDCQYHNILINDNKVVFTGFEKWCFDVHIKDFYRLFRKIMEKNRWEQDLGRKLIEKYCEKQEVPQPAMKLFFLHLCFPEKYWKIMNYYMNSRKSYISERNVEKCHAQVRLEEKRLAFLDHLIIDIYEKGDYNKSIRYFR